MTPWTCETLVVCRFEGGTQVTHEQFEDELLAPPAGVMTESGQPESDQAEPIEWHPSHGFTDSRMAVRIWLDESARRISKVHVSPRWREILGPNRELQDAFGEAFFGASVRSSGGHEPLDSAALPEPTADPESPLTIADLPVVKERILALSEKQHTLLAKPDHEVRWADLDGDRVMIERGPVSLSLSWAGLADRVRFDRNWLRTATSEQIASAVHQAATSAYARYVPPTFVPGEHEELATEFFQAQRDLLSIMAKENG